MDHAVEKDEFGVRNASSEIFRVFAFDKFVMLALYDPFVILHFPQVLDGVDTAGRILQTEHSGTTGF
jgi:hypothetical protein